MSFALYKAFATGVKAEALWASSYPEHGARHQVQGVSFRWICRDDFFRPRGHFYGCYTPDGEELRS